jgi:pentatricopeptide repeat protein
MCLRSCLALVGRTPSFRHFDGGRLAFVTTKRFLSSLDSSYNQRIEALVHKLHTSVWTNRISEIHKCYPLLVEDVKRHKNTDPNVSIPPPLSKPQLVDLLDILAASGRSFDLALVEKILADMPDVFGLQPTTEDHTTIIRALIRYGNFQTIHRWLLKMSRKPGHVNPSLNQWHEFLEYCREKGELGALRAAIKTMRRSGCRPANATFKILIEALFGAAPPVPQIITFSSVMDDMVKEGLRYHPSIAASLHLGYVNLGHNYHASRVERLYKSRFTEACKGNKQEPKWIDRLKDEAERNGAKAAVKLCKIYLQEGCTASSPTLVAILHNSTNPSELRYAEEELHVQAGAAHWSILINNTVRTGDVTKALSIYNQSQIAGIRPDAVMLHPIINALCMTRISPPSEAAIDQALALYQDLASSVPIPNPTEAPAPTQDAPIASSNHPPGPDAKIYNSLLRALSSSTNVAKYYPLAMSLLDDMHARNVSMNDSMTTTSLTILLMRRSSSVSEAFDVYQRMCQRDKSVIDAHGYAVLLNAFCKMTFPDQPLPSLQYYFEIAKGMQTAGHGITAEVYTILLRQLASLATRMTEDAFPVTLRDSLIAAIRRAHNHLTVDASISPDPPLWNQLMDTYQRAGCFGEAYRVWDMMYLSRKFDNTSVSIILDACGYAGDWNMTKQICLKLLEDGFPFNQRNWNTWLECLCRQGRLNDAVKMVCLEMGKLQEDVAPDAESVRILMKFATRTNQQNEVQSRIKRYLPKLWDTLPIELRQSF